jgi:hypothetical protein
VLVRPVFGVGVEVRGRVGCMHLRKNIRVYWHTWQAAIVGPRVA